MKNYGPINKKLKKMIHGGDYNPDQWIDYEGIMDEDFRLMNLAKCNTMSLGIFSWMTFEKEEGIYDFEWFDELMDRMAEEGKYTVLATPSGAKPAWLSAKYPEVLRVNEDRARNLHGFRHNHCYTSPVYREKVTRINSELAKRYKDHPALIVWHISNEFGGECHCDLCQEAFRQWLKVKYDNNLDKLNKAWWATFWSHTYTDWSQIESPSSIGEDKFHGLTLDWKRFVTYQTTDYMKCEIEAIRKYDKETPITTNFMDTYEGLNYWEMAKELDVISWDSYPMWHKGKTDYEVAANIGFVHNLNRCHKQGKPFMLMESTPSVSNWLDVCKQKRPGVHLLESIQAIAHGADTVQYFQWRKSRGAFEKFHGAVVDHSGHEHTRVFRDVAAVGNVLDNLDKVVGTSVKPEVAIIFDWENRWAINDYKGYSNKHKNYMASVHSYHKAYWELGIPVDVIDMTQDISKYKLVVAPMLYMLRDGIEDKIDNFVKNGGTLVTTYISGTVNENDLCYMGGFPGPLKKIVGIWAEEVDALYDSDRNSVSVQINGLDSKSYEVKEIAEIIHCETAKALAVYDGDYYKDMPALTVNNYGHGKAYYVAFRNNDDFEVDFNQWLARDMKLARVLECDIPKGVSVQTRYDEVNQFIFVMNFNAIGVSMDFGDNTYSDVLTGDTVTGVTEIHAYSSLILSERP